MLKVNPAERLLTVTPFSTLTGKGRRGVEYRRASHEVAARHDAHERDVIDDGQQPDPAVGDDAAGVPHGPGGIHSPLSSA